MSVNSGAQRQNMAIPKPIKITAKILEATSVKMAAKFAMKIFVTPVKFPLPKREEKMDTARR